MKEIRKIGLVYLTVDKASTTQELSNKLMRRPKLGLDYLRASLFEINIESELYDQQISYFNEGSLLKNITKDSIDLLGFYVCTENIKNVLSYIGLVRRNTLIPIIAGGPAGAIYTNELIKAGCEIVCIGEGEFTIRDIIDYYEKKKSINDIEGIAYLNQDGKVVFNLARSLIGDLDSLPFPYRDKKYINKYNNCMLYTIKKPYISIITSRGCIYRCAFCTSHIFWHKKYRQRTVESVIEEIEINKKLHNIKYIEFIDDIFAQNIHWLEKFCNNLKKKKMNVKWACILHPLTFQGNKERAFSIMAEAGCDAISFGAQSANGNILKNINRTPQECDELRKSIYLSKLNNITTIVTYILGLPGENLSTTEEDYKFCIDTKPHLVDFHPFCIIKSSEIDTRYRSSKFTKLTRENLDKLSKKYMRKYYSNPIIMLQLLKDIFNKNPKWFLDFLLHSLLVIKAYR